jgi:phosphate starvation-inducible PhoH-like protein
MIITGDPSQVDLPYGQISGLVEALEILPKIEGVAKIVFSAADVVRHRLVTEIVLAYDAAAKKIAENPPMRGENRPRTYK